MSLIRYKLTDTELQICIRDWPIRKIRYTDIEEILENAHKNENWCKFWEVFSENWPDFGHWRQLMIRRKSGWFRLISITPPDPLGFSAELKKKISVFHSSTK